MTPPRKPPEKKRVRMSLDKKRAMLACVVRNRDVFEQVVGSLDVDAVAEIGPLYGLLYRLVREHHEAYAALPDVEQLRLEVQAELEADPDAAADFEVEDLQAFIDYAWADPDFDPTEARWASWGVDRVRQFLEERLADRTARELAPGGTLPADFPDLITRIQNEAADLEGLVSRRTSSIFEPGWDKEPLIRVTPTQISFLDSYLCGGTAPGEVYIIMAPYGTCKTLMSVQGCWLAARAAYARTTMADWDGRKGKVFFVSYEAPVAEFRQRILCCGAMVHADRLRKMRGLEDLSTTGHLEPYERKLFAKELARGERVPGERERIEAMIPIVNDHIEVVDMLERGRGTGFVSEIARELTTRCRRGDCYAALVWIDYAVVAARRHIAAGKATMDQLRELLAGMPDRLVKEVAAPLQVPVFLNQQFAAAVQGRAPGVLLHHSDAAESKAIGENAHFCFCVGNPDKDGHCVLACTKHRRGPQMPPRVLKIDGALGRVLDTGGAYVLDESTRTIVSKRDRDIVYGPEVAFGGGGPPPPGPSESSLDGGEEDDEDDEG